MSKVIAYGNEANVNVMKGIDAVANIVKVTVGPRGRNVLIREQESQPVITNDGVTIAKAVQLKDTMEDAGAQLIIQAANKTNNAAGDGTTTTTILAQTMIHKYYEYKDNNKDVNPVSVQKDMIAAANKVSDYLNQLEQDGMLVQVRDNKKTLISIENYDKYQVQKETSDMSEDMQKVRSRTGKGHKQ